MSEPTYLGDGVSVRLAEGGMIELTGSAYSHHNVIFLDPDVYNSLRRFAQSVGYESRERETATGS